MQECYPLNTTTILPWNHGLTFFSSLFPLLQYPQPPVMSRVPISHSSTRLCLCTVCLLAVALPGAVGSSSPWLTGPGRRWTSPDPLPGERSLWSVHIPTTEGIYALQCLTINIKIWTYTHREAYTKIAVYDWESDGTKGSLLISPHIGETVNEEDILPCVPPSTG